MNHWFQGALVLQDRLLPNGLLQVEGKKIVGVWDLEQEKAPAPDPRSLTKLEQGYVTPGFIDMHIHGGGGADFMDGDPESVATITETHARHGTTGLLCTTLTASEEQILKAVRAAKAAPRRGARVLGFHIEGPYINIKYKGAQNPDYFRTADLAEIDRWLAEGDPEHVWQVTLAPELEGAIPAIRHLVSRGVVVSAGHTECTYDQLKTAAEAGVSHITHLFNAMRGLHHREPGTVGGALTLPGLTCELIADGIHVHPASMKVAVGARGTGNICLITDAMMATGKPEGEYDLGGLKVIVKNGEARLESGQLASSVLTMAGAVRNMVQMVGVTLPEAVAMASLNPARRLRLQKGAIAAGLDADLVILDKDLQVRSTIVEGETVYSRD